ncbi:MAG: EF-P 5-aminopentanol modification-associated protein YfmH [Bacillota bacterium]
MRKLHYERLNETLHRYKVLNTLEIHHVQKPDAAKTFVSITVPLGSVHEGYKDENKEVHHVPRGIAHFLEHAMFEKNGTDLSKAFAREEASINAYTDHHATTYLFSATANIETHTVRLIEMLLNPEFTESTVEKEKKIIKEELNMHKDDPFYLQYRGLMNNLYATHPLKDDILGSEASIDAMSLQDLKAMHEAYYDPSRMKVVVVGNIEPKTLHQHLEKAFEGFPSSMKTPLEIRLETVEQVNTKYEKTHYDILTPSLMMGIKLSQDAYKTEDPIRKFLVYSIAVEGLLGSTSRLYERLLKENLVNDAYDVDVIFEPSYANILLFAETDDPDTLRSELKKALAERTEGGLDSEDFIRVKRRMYGQFIRSFDSSERLASEIVDHLQFNVVYHDLIQLFETITEDEVAQALQTLKQSAISFFAALPKA